MLFCGHDSRHEHLPTYGLARGSSSTGLGHQAKRLETRDIASALGVTEGAVSQWLKLAREHGEQRLAARKATGRPPRLTAAQRQQLPTLLAQGPEAYGFRGKLWNRRRVAVILQREFGVKHSLPHVGTLLRQSGWSRQKPVRRARQRDEVAIAGWPKTRWKSLKKLVVNDERSSWSMNRSIICFPPSPGPWAPGGLTPILTEWHPRDHLSVISGITRDGRSTYRTYENAINGELAARFLKHLQQTLDERLLVIWDGSPIHRSRAVKAVLAAAHGAIWLERLPGYAPDLNPDENVWQHLKHVQLANACSPDVDTHRHELQNAIRRFKRRQTELIPAFFRHAGL